MNEKIVKFKIYFQSSKLIIAAFVAMISLFGCKSTQMVTENKIPQSSPIVPDTSIAQFPSIDTILPLQYSDIKTINQYDYEWISYRAKTNYTINENNGECNLYFVNRIDSIIYLNINLAGIEVIRMVLTPDEVIYVNKLNKTFYKGEFLLFQKIAGVPVTFDMIQAILNGKDFQNFDSIFTISEEPDQVILQTNTRKEKNKDLYIIQKMILNKELLMIQNLITVKSNLRKLNMEYLNYQPVEPHFCFQEMRLETANIKMNLILKNIKYNTPGPTYITIPESFTPVDLK
ncbi:MAG: deoxyuridine 5'-triphosphate nucleotidohydrolase [Bacteroidetes bacterium]|nr:deoxyuridine 5'-triphosphate nucleotidohydrolase [Bacteroidota bacterium]